MPRGERRFLSEIGEVVMNKEEQIHAGLIAPSHSTEKEVLAPVEFANTVRRTTLLPNEWENKRVSEAVSERMTTLKLQELRHLRRMVVDLRAQFDILLAALNLYDSEGALSMYDKNGCSSSSLAGNQ